MDMRASWFRLLARVVAQWRRPEFLPVYWREQQASCLGRVFRVRAAAGGNVKRSATKFCEPRGVDEVSSADSARRKIGLDNRGHSDYNSV